MQWPSVSWKSYTLLVNTVVYIKKTYTIFIKIVLYFQIMYNLFNKYTSVSSDHIQKFMTCTSVHYAILLWTLQYISVHSIHVKYILHSTRLK